MGGNERESGRVTREQEREFGREREGKWKGLGSCSYFKICIDLKLLLKIHLTENRFGLQGPHS